MGILRIDLQFVASITAKVCWAISNSSLVGIINTLTLLAGLCIFLNHKDPKDRKEKIYRSFRSRSVSPYQAWNPAHNLAKTISTKPTNRIFFAVFEVLAV